MIDYDITLTFQKTGIFGGINRQSVNCPVAAENSIQAIKKARVLCNKVGYKSKIVREQISTII